MNLPTFPASYDAWKTRTPLEDEREHVVTCPLHEDNHDGEPAVCERPTDGDAAEIKADERADK